jgi:hypothetical protein
MIPRALRLLLRYSGLTWPFSSAAWDQFEVFRPIPSARPTIPLVTGCRVAMRSVVST